MNFNIEHMNKEKMTNFELSYRELDRIADDLIANKKADNLIDGFLSLNP